MYNNYGYSYSSMGNGTATIVWTILASVFALVGGILIYVLFLNPKKDQKLTGFLAWLKDFLTFKIMLIETILKVCYLIFTIFVILISFCFINTSFLMFMLILILGPIIIRLIYEGSLMFIMIWKNTTEIEKKLKK